MAFSVSTNIGREKLAKARAGDLVLPAITHMAFGNGGADANGNLIAPDSSNSLNNELLRKLVDSHSYPIPTTCRYICKLATNELVGQIISELALVDANGDIVVKKNIANKEKQADIEMIFEIDDKF